MDAIIKSLKERRVAIDERLTALTTTEDGAETRNLTAEEGTELDALLEERGTVTSRIEELTDQALAEARAAKHAAETAEVTATTPEARAQVTEPNPVYRADGKESFFRDLALGGLRGDTDARDRLVRSQESRALSTTAGAGGQFAPPAWLIDEYVALARAGRVTADLCQKDVLPSGVSSINLPTIATGAAVGVQGSQNSALTQTDLTTSSVTGTISTIGGKQVVSMQLLQQSGIPFDRVILGDLARAYATQVDATVVAAISGLAGANAGAVTATTPTGAGSIFSQTANGIQLIQVNRFASPNAIVMHPRRWAALLGAVDTANRPLVVPNGASFNQLATSPDGAPQQTQVGTMLGLPVYTDPSVPTNKGAGTNQDEVYIFVREDLWLYESALQATSFDATYADQASILFRVLGYMSFIPNRYPKAVSVLGGAGLVPPSF